MIKQTASILQRPTIVGAPEEKFHERQDPRQAVREKEG